MFNRLLLFLVLSVPFHSLAENIGEQWIEDYQEAVKIAKEKQRPILMYFSGSDWCKPCMLLTQTIFQTERFQAFSQDSLVLLHLDFPRRKANLPPDDIVEKREALAEKYNLSGAFPYVVLLSPNSEVIGATGYRKNTPNQYVNHLKSILQNFKFGSAQNPDQKRDIGLQQFKKDTVLMGAQFQISALCKNPQLGHNAIEMAYYEIERIESLISSWNQNSQTFAINKNAGIKPVKVAEELYNLIRRAIKVSELTNGAFDISYASIDKHWKFDRTMKALPNQIELEKSVQKINYKNIVLNSDSMTVFLKEKGMKIGFGAIGKGYAANRARHIMKSLGIESGMVNAGGDLITWGNGMNGEKWKIGIADPEKKGGYIAYLEINKMAVVTSGDYERYAIIDGIRYAHIIDPRTGYPCKGLKSVTIVCADAEIADALATSVFVLGQEKGLELINQIMDVDCILINDENEIITTDNLQLNYFN